MSPLGISYLNQIGSLEIDTNLLYLYALLVGFICTLITVPLRGISSIMNFKDNSQAKKINNIQKDLDDLKKD